MIQKVNCVMLIDDNRDDNFFHERVLKRSGLAETIVVKEKAEEALEYLKLGNESAAHRPDLIFLDINMPRMNGWEFLEAYGKLDKGLQNSVVITMLSTSENPDDKTKALSYSLVKDYKIKPLTQEMLDEIVKMYFNLPVC